MPSSSSHKALKHLNIRRRLRGPGQRGLAKRRFPTILCWHNAHLNRAFASAPGSEPLAASVQGPSAAPPAPAGCVRTVRLRGRPTSIDGASSCYSARGKWARVRSSEQIASQFLDEGWPPGNSPPLQLLWTLAFMYVDPIAIQIDLDSIRFPPEFVSGLPWLLLLDEIHGVEGWQFWLKQVVDKDARNPRSMLAPRNSILRPACSSRQPSSRAREGGTRSGFG